MSIPPAHTPPTSPGSHPRSSSGRRLPTVEWLIAAVLWVALIALLLQSDPRVGDDDFGVFYAGAHALASGGSPYVGDFVSPPWFALYLLPLTLLTVESARGVWLCLNLAALVLATSLCARLAGFRWPSRRVLLTAALFGLWPPSEFGLRLGQNSLLVWLLLLGALWCARRERWATAGALLALASVKPHLAFLFVGGLLVRAHVRGRLRRCALAGTLVLAVLMAAVALLAPQSYADLLALRPRPWNYWGSNTSLLAAVGSLLGEGWAAGLAYAALAVPAAALVVARWRRLDLPMVRLGAVTACATLLIGPYSYPYDVVLLMLPALAIAAALVSAQATAWSRLLLGAAVLGALWLLPRPADYSAVRFLTLLAPLALLAVLGGLASRIGSAGERLNADDTKSPYSP